MATTIIERSEWGARAPRGQDYVAPSQRSEFIVHHSAGPPNQTLRSIQDFHLDGRGWSDIAYNLLVDDAGNAYEGRGWNMRGAHAVGHNTSGIGVCYIGQNAPSAEAKAAIRALYEEANQRTGRTLDYKGHGEVNPSSCPGSNLQSWINDGMPAGAVTIDEGMMEMIINLREGDGASNGKREHVKFLQLLVDRAGASLPKYGIDGEYGEETSRAALYVRKQAGSNQDFGDWISGWAAFQILDEYNRAVVRDEMANQG